eukprot:758819-Hanusia_phi.AAC.5
MMEITEVGRDEVEGVAVCVFDSQRLVQCNEREGSMSEWTGILGSGLGASGQRRQEKRETREKRERRIVEA